MAKRNPLAALGSWLGGLRPLDPPTNTEPLVLKYLGLRTGIGIIGMALPVALVFGRMILESSPGILDSVSDYYYSLMRGVLVGGLCAVGVFLISYRYVRWGWDDILGDIAGVFAIGVALFPTDCPTDVYQCPTPQPMMIGMVHWICGGGFLILLALFALWLFPRTVPGRKDDRTPQKIWRNKVYYFCGSVIVVCIVGCIIVQKFLPYEPWQQSYHSVFWLELVATLMFGIAWLVKGQAIWFMNDKPAQGGMENRATKVEASILGILAGLLGLVHGCLEIIQRNFATSGGTILALGPHCQPNRMWHLCYPAFTFIPNFFFTGVLAIIVSLIVIVGSAAFVQWKYYGWFLVVFSIILLFVGGGYISPILGIVTGLGVVGTTIPALITWGSRHHSVHWLRLLAKLWPWFLSGFVVWLAVIGILGYFFNEFVLSLAPFPFYFALGLLLLAVLTGLVHDIQMTTSQGNGFTISYPQNWQTTKKANNLFTFTDSTGGITMTIIVAPDPNGADTVASTALTAAKGLLKNAQTVSVPSTTTVGGESWSQISASGTKRLNNQDTNVQVVVLAVVHPANTPIGKSFTILYQAPVSTFSQDDTNYFQPMLQSFKFA